MNFLIKFLIKKLNTIVLVLGPLMGKKGLSMPVVLLSLVVSTATAMFTISRLLKQNIETKEMNKKVSYEKIFVLAAQILQARWESGDHNPLGEDVERRTKTNVSPCTQCNPWYFKNYLNSCIGGSGGQINVTLNGITYSVNVSLEEGANVMPPIRRLAFDANFANTRVSADPSPKTGLIVKLSLLLRSDARQALTREYVQYVILQDTCNEVYVSPTNKGGTGYCTDESCTPASTRNLSGYYIDKFEVTNGQFLACRESGGCPLGDPPTNPVANYYSDPRFYNSPVTSVTAAQAKQYCNWAGKRLPTAHEWRYAARGEGGTRRYAWPDLTSPNTPVGAQGIFSDTLSIAAERASAVIDDGAACAGNDICDGAAVACSAAEGSYCNGTVCRDNDLGNTSPGGAEFAIPPVMPGSVCVRDGLGNISGLGSNIESDGRGVFGTYNQTGNVAEWVVNEADNTQHYVMGGSWEVDNNTPAEEAYLRLDTMGTLAAYTGAGLTAASVGFRCVRNCDAAGFGEACTTDTGCCSGSCNAGFCVAAPVGGSCNVAADCLSGTCTQVGGVGEIGFCT